MKTRTVAIMNATVAFVGALVVAYTALHVAQWNSGPDWWRAGAGETTSAPLFGGPFIPRGE